MFDPDKIAAEHRKRGDEWADTDAAYRALDEASKSILAEIKGDYLGSCKSATEAETRALASNRYKDHLAALAEARRAANRARVAYDTYKAWLELKRTQAANTRAEMNLR